MREVDALVDLLRSLGFEVVISHPDRTWHVSIWSRKPPSEPPFEIFMIAPSRRELIAILKAVLLGYNVARSQ